jgi:hypothetical protein
MFNELQPGLPAEFFQVKIFKQYGISMLFLDEAIIERELKREAHLFPALSQLRVREHPTDCAGAPGQQTAPPEEWRDSTRRDCWVR